MKYLKKPQKEHPYLPARATSKSSRRSSLRSTRKRNIIDDQNHIRLGGSNERRDLSSSRSAVARPGQVFSLARSVQRTGVLYYGDKKIDRFLQGEWKSHLDSMRATLEELKKTLPPQYPFLHAIQDVKKPSNMKVLLRGSADNPGEEAPRRFLAILSPAERAPFTKGSGRLELAEAIADPKNPLTARVMVNRIWQHHFGQGIVRTPSNFGQLGDRPSIRSCWIIWRRASSRTTGRSKRCIARSCCRRRTQLSAENCETNYAADPENRLLWRANRQRLDAEALRDSLLFVAGKLDLKLGGHAGPAHRRESSGAPSTVSSAAGSSIRCWRCSTFRIRTIPASSDDRRTSRCSGCSS